MRRIKSWLGALLALVMLWAVIPAAAAADMQPKEAADALYTLGLFSGTGVNSDGTPAYDLNRVPTRNEAITMLVALIGKTEEAKAGSWTIPFTDVEPWARPYVGYAYAHQLTSGLSATTYGGSQPVTASQYLTFVLKALGYESGTDFQWDQAWVLTDRLGITEGRYSAQTSAFFRGDVAQVSWAALSAKENGKGNTLAQKLMNEGVFTSAQYEAAGQGSGQGGGSVQQPVKKEGTFVGSLESDKYHDPNCRYAKKILKENEIWFDTAEEAQHAGYSPCGVCHPGY